jgi:hypothetical protein
MAKMKPGQISAKRAYEISDSLKKKANFNGQWAMSTEKLAAKEKNTTVKDILSKHSTQTWREVGHDFEKSDRLKTRADAAMAKAKATAGRDVPLPSSEGIMSTISNKLSQLFK